MLGHEWGQRRRGKGANSLRSMADVSDVSDGINLDPLTVLLVAGKSPRYEKHVTASIHTGLDAF